MVIEIPDEVIVHAPISEQEIKVEILILLYQKRVLTLERAARLAGVTRLDFQRLLADHNVSIHYDISDLEMDLRHLADLKN